MAEERESEFWGKKKKTTFFDLSKRRNEAKIL